MEICNYNKKSNMPDGRKGVPMKLVIPEYKTLELDTIFLDIERDGQLWTALIPPSVKERLIALSEQFRIYVLTADTHGNAESAVRRASGDPGDISDR